MADGQCPALTAPSSTPIVDILEPICATGEGCDDEDGDDESCYDCSLVPYMIDELIADRVESGEDASALRNAKKVLSFMCNPCIEPIYAELIRMDEPDAPPIPASGAYESACGSPQCLNEYHEVAAVFNASSGGRTLSDFKRLMQACESHKPDKPAVARAVTTLLQSIGTGKQLGSMLAAESSREAGKGHPRAVIELASATARAGLLCAVLAAFALMVLTARYQYHAHCTESDPDSDAGSPAAEDGDGTVGLGAAGVVAMHSWQVSIVGVASSSARRSATAARHDARINY
eukprot:CAMPEP_0119413366 /NCGR_PEP_ID=MMETSP1335-20130426/5477_1 /TAXON_ID=259385 /ORGANISM="Chrysoculter rhomboideus, Strain RCC1486" /LENGTH=289 /DNA_ID=CAMNT_0007438153 /DNA_START=85 /DNA_END=950 /DNA_ORIENTATION=-